MRTGHLFAGIDGLGLGLEGHGFEAAWFSEYEAAPSRLLAHHYPDVPNHGDITQIDWTQVEPVDALTGGFPCQDLSYAGRGAGLKEGTRSGLWFRFADAIRVLRPRIVIVENVRALTARGGDIVLADLAGLGFDAWWTTVRASDVGAAHRRERLFIVAVDADDGGRDGRGSGESATSWDGREGRFGRSAGAGSVAADGGGGGLVRGTQQDVGANQPGQQASRGDDALGHDPAATDADLKGPQRGEPATRRNVSAWSGSWGEFEPAVRRWESVLGRPAPVPATDGRLSPEFVEWHMGFPEGWTAMLSRNERLKALGNAVVPQVADLVGRWALELVEREVAA